MSSGQGFCFENLTSEIQAESDELITSIGIEYYS